MKWHDNYMHIKSTSFWTWWCKFPVYDPAKNSFKKPKSAELKINSLHGWWPSYLTHYHDWANVWHIIITEPTSDTLSWLSQRLTHYHLWTNVCHHSEPMCDTLSWLTQRLTHYHDCANIWHIIITLTGIKLMFVT